MNLYSMPLIIYVANTSAYRSVFLTYHIVGNVSTQTGYNANNVSERDLLRTEGDPAAAGYTIKEAIALTRSVVS